MNITDSPHTGGTGLSVVYLNGSDGSPRHWRRLPAESAPQWRHIPEDERGRGESKQSSGRRGHLPAAGRPSR